MNILIITLPKALEEMVMKENVLIEDDSSVYEIDSECLERFKKGQECSKQNQNQPVFVVDRK